MTKPSSSDPYTFSSIKLQSTADSHRPQDPISQKEKDSLVKVIDLQEDIDFILMAEEEDIQCNESLD